MIKKKVKSSLVHRSLVTLGVTVPLILAIFVASRLTQNTDTTFSIFSEAAANCIQAKPYVEISNVTGASDVITKPGQALQYSVKVSNMDSDECKSTTFVVTPSLPNGFEQDLPNFTTTLVPGEMSEKVVSITSPLSAADGDYSIIQIASRFGDNTSVSTGTTYYKVDSTAR